MQPRATDTEVASLRAAAACRGHLVWQVHPGCGGGEGRGGPRRAKEGSNGPATAAASKKKAWTALCAGGGGGGGGAGEVGEFKDSPFLDHAARV